LTSHSIALVTSAIFAAGFCIIGGQIAANALTATYYPTAIRSTGMGWALGVGRVGSIVGPLVGGAMLAARAGVDTLFTVAAIPALIAAAAALALVRVARPAGKSVGS
jgi:AAHS family 4-hydroxybenzoate transporter-like MFS transporter